MYTETKQITINTNTQEENEQINGVKTHHLKDNVFQLFYETIMHAIYIIKSTTDQRRQI